MRSSKAAWVQGVLLVVVIAAIALALAMRLHRPFDRDTLAIQVAQLQSGAAEARLLADYARADQLAPGFVRQHARQMAEKIENTNGKLEKAAQPALAGQKTQAQRLGASLHTRLMLLARGEPPRAAPGFHATEVALGALHKQLKPAD